MARTRPRTPERPAGPPVPPPPPPPPPHPADVAIAGRIRSNVPPDMLGGYDAVVLAFIKYEAGDDEAARNALQAIGLTSPFLEWKVLLRGLMAYAANDTARAIENFQRLNPDRMPAALAAPLRAAVDKAFKDAQRPEAAAAIEKQFLALHPDPLADGLRQLRADLSRDKPLASAFRQVDKLLPLFRMNKGLAPLIPKLAGCFYRAILTHGEPADMPKYRRAFGPPTDDPDFHRLEGQIYEANGAQEEAIKHWAAYEAWLAKGPPGWPADVLARARAAILQRLGQLAVEVGDYDDGYDDEDDYMFMFGGRRGGRGGRRPPPPAPPDPTGYWRRAAELAPAWELPARELFDWYMDEEIPASAEAVARKFLEHNPTAIGMTSSLAELLGKSGHAAEALELRKRALAINPLDRTLRALTAFAHLAAARRQMVDGPPAAADETLDAGRELCEEFMPAGYFSLRAITALKRGRADTAEEFRARAVGAPGGRLAATLYMAADAALAKLKPAAKKPFDQALTAALAGSATPREVSLLYGAWDQYFLEGLTYRGQKTQEKKIQTLALTAATSGEGPLLDFEILAQSFAHRRAWAALPKIATKLRQRFPTSPVFPLLQAEVEFAKADDAPRPYKVIDVLALAKILAERSTEPRHKELLARIQELQEQATPNYFGRFFGGF
ncbi:hypothetical protein [Fimbriiglobus ruber]|uniref:Tetratricopeptide repeat protein n=1 Tax=Fimbriiglobus ruber TaxID=1908690 RepID=A0A225DVJ7_9BACT|nr:hypothetical protein [Fimbriiglobus ruber]OWK45033.1 hypothetical protein FRUB_01364 [Fimbriiglobus ruber]